MNSELELGTLEPRVIIALGLIVLIICILLIWASMAVPRIKAQRRRLRGIKD